MSGAIDTTKREIVSWVRGNAVGSTQSVILNTDEVMSNSDSVQAERTKTVTQNGVTTITPSSGYDSMAKTKVTIAVNLKAYKYHPDEGDDVIIYAFQNTPTKALTTSFTKVTVTYESSTDTILYDSKTFVRYSDGDIELA